MIRLLQCLWASPATLLGLAGAILASITGGEITWRNGVIEAHGGLLAVALRGGKFWRGGAAMTLGHVILARNRECLQRSRAHELAHVRQFERWGVLLLPAYVLTGWWLAWRGFDPYLDNPFEPKIGDR